MKSLLRTLAIMELVLGLIGSFVLANQYGNVVDFTYNGTAYYERNWGLTIGIFIGCLFSVLVIYAILGGLCTVLENQETIYNKIIMIYNSTSSYYAENNNNPSQVMESTGSNNVPIWTPNIEGLALVGVYAYPAQYDDSLIYVLIFRNNSEKDITFSCKGTARDAEGNIIGSYEDTEAVCSGYEVPITLRFKDLNFHDVIGLNYSMSELQDGQKPAQNCLKYQTSDMGDKIVMTVTNTGTEKVQFVEGHLFYLKEGKMVAQEETYFDEGTGDVSMQPGVPCTETIQKPYDIEYDSVLVYLTGRRD